MERRGSVECRQQPCQFQQLTGCDIVKRGTLYVKNPPSLLPAAFSIQVRTPDTCSGVSYTVTLRHAQW